jgi:hypothetical protein
VPVQKLHRLARCAELSSDLCFRDTIEHLQNGPIPVLDHPIVGAFRHLNRHKTSIKPDPSTTS